MLLREMANKFKFAQIITHDDLDGYGAGAILVKALRVIGFDIDNIKVTNTDYTNPLPFDDEYNLYLISDISISNLENMHKLEKYASNPSNLVIWFDHHKTSIEMEAQFKGERIPGLRSTDGCGALLCWIFYQVVCRLDYNEEATIEEALNILFNMRNDVKFFSMYPVSEINCYPNQDSQVRLYFKPLPRAIRLTDDYDRFILKYPESKYLMEAFNSYPKFKRDCKSDYFQNHYMYYEDEEYIKFIKIGKKQLLWKKIQMLNTIKSNGFIASFPIEGMSNIQMICVNSTNKSSLMLGKCYGKGSTDLIQYNYGCIYKYEKNVFTVSIYCANPIDIPREKKEIGKIYDAADICKRFNGGGHPGAAGFVTNELKFSDITSLPKALKKQIDDEIMELMEEVEKV